MSRINAFFERFFKLALGWTLLFVGIIGLFLPFLPGTLIIFFSLVFLSTRSQWVKKHLDALRARYPRQAARLQRLRRDLITRFGRWRRKRPRRKAAS